MAPLIPLDTWSSRRGSANLEPKGRCFIIAEGANTEYWYLSDLVFLLAKRGLPEHIEIKPVKRTEGDRNKSHPRALAKQAALIKEDENGSFGFDAQTDRVVIVYDVDVYKGDENAYLSDLREFGKVTHVAVTNPSFELFLLLHEEGSFERYIKPYSKEILANEYVKGTRRRFVSKLTSDVFGMNAKTNEGIATLAEHFETACTQEKLLNQDPKTAIGCLTSNIALMISQTIQGKGDSENPMVQRGLSSSADGASA